MRRCWMAGAIVVLFAAAPAGAQFTLRTVVTDVKHGVGDILYVWSSPVRADARDWAAAGAVAGVALLALPIDDDVDAWLRRHPSSVVAQSLTPFRKGWGVPFETLGSGRRLQPLSGILYLTGLVAGSPALRDAGLGCASAQQAQTLLHEVVRVAVARRRPGTAGGDQYDVQLRHVDDWERHSFYGGHAANIMACATFFSERFDLRGAEPALYLLAVGVGAARIADEAHWTSDTIVGMALGYAIGRTVARRSLARAAQRSRP